MRAKSHLLIGLLFTLLFLVSCNNTSTPAVDDSGVTEAATVVATPEPTVTPEPTAATVRFDPPTTSESGVLTPAQFAIDSTLIDATMMAQVMPGSPWLPEESPALNGMPPYLLVTFDADSAETRPFPGSEAQIRVLPIEAMRAMYTGSGDEQKINDRVNAIAEALFRRLDTITGPIPVLPGTDGAQALKGRMHYLDFEGGSGVGFLAHYTDAVAPVTNDALFYMFQGITDDGAHFVSAAIPVAAAFLPDSADAVTAAISDELAADPNAYFKRVGAELEAANTTDYTPDLAALDALLASMLIDPAAAPGDVAMVAAPTATPEPISAEIPDALIGSQWRWQSATTADGAITVAEPELYTLEMTEDGGVLLQADCNYANGRYTLDGEQFTIDVTTATTAACAADSLDAQYVALLESAQAYAVEDDILVLQTADGSVTLTTNGAVAIAAAPTATPAATATATSTQTPTPESSPSLTATPTATAQATAAATPVATPLPGATATPFTGDELPQNLGELSIGMSTLGVANTFAWQSLPGVPYDNAAEPVTVGLPPHVLVTFNGATAEEAVADQAYLYVVPQASYALQWNANSDRSVPNALDTLNGWIDTGGATFPGNNMQVLPLVAGANDIVVQPAFLAIEFVAGRALYRPIYRRPNPGQQRCLVLCVSGHYA